MTYFLTLAFLVVRKFVMCYIAPISVVVLCVVVAFVVRYTIRRASTMSRRRYTPRLDGLEPRVSPGDVGYVPIVVAPVSDPTVPVPPPVTPDDPPPPPEPSPGPFPGTDPPIESPPPPLGGPVGPG